MLFQYLKNAVYNLFRYKFNTFTAIAGLAIGVLAAMLLLSYALYYLDYDHNVSDADQWYRVRMDTRDDNGRVRQRATFYDDLGQWFAQDIPEITDVACIWTNTLKINLICDDKPMHMGPHGFMQESLLEHYPFEFVYCAEDSVLMRRRSIMISRSISERIFGDENPVGKHAFFANRREGPEFTIAGVFEDLPENLHLGYKVYLFIEDDYEPSGEEVWRSYEHLRVHIPNPNDVKTVEEKFNAKLLEYRHLIENKEEATVHLDPVTKIHFMQGLEQDQPTMNFQHVVAVIVLSGLFLLSALLNFINLIVFTWRKRGAEFSSRRAIGAGRGDLFAQLNVEYLLRYLLAIVAGVALYFFLLGAFSDIVQLDLSGYTVFGGGVWPLLAGGLLLLGVVTSVVVSLRFAMQSVRSEEQLHRSRHTGSMLVLAVQIVLSAMFIVLGLVVSAQMRFIHSRDLGFKHENMVEYHYVTAENFSDSYTSTSALLDSLCSIDGVTSISATAASVATPSVENDQMLYEIDCFYERDGEKIHIPTRIMAGYGGYLETLGVELLAGEHPVDETWAGIVVNQTFVDTYFPNENPVGMALMYLNPDVSDSTQSLPIQGVVKDVWFFPMHNKMPPMAFLKYMDGAENFQITYDPARKGEVIGRLEETFAYFASGVFLDYSSAEVDDTLRGFYAAEDAYSRIVLFCALVIALISAMGVYSISSLYVQEQMRDIAVRKICGAGLGDIFRVYTRSFVALLTVSGAVGLALGHMLSETILSSFSEHAPGLFVYHIIGFGVTAVIVLAPMYLNIRRAYGVKPFLYLQNRD